MRTYSRHLKFTVTFLCLLGVTGAHSAPAITPASDLHNDVKRASAQHPVFLLLFSLPGCRPCEIVEKNYLSSLQRNPRYSGKLLIRKVDDFVGERTLVDFSGTQLSQRDLATRYKVRYAPTLVFVDTKGNAIADPLVGADETGFYGAYLDTSLTSALRKVGHE